MRADLPPAASGGQGTRHAAATPAATRDKGEYGGRRGCRGARPSHPLPPAAQATTPGCRAEAASQRQKRKEENFPPRKCVHAGPPKEKILPRQAEASAFKVNAPRLSGGGRKKSPQHQRAGARRRSPQRGSAAAGAHITREAGRCAPIGPLRRAADKVHDMRQRHPPPHGTKGEYGGRRGCRGARPSHPLPPAAQATTPGCRAEAASQRQKRKEENFPPRKCVHAGPPKEKILPRQAEASAFKVNAPRLSGGGRKKSPQHQRAGARRRSPQRGSAAAGAHITREAGRCAPIGPLRRAADKVHDMRQRHPPPHGTKGEYGGRRGCRGARPSHPLPPAAQATTPGCRAEAASQQQKRKEKERNHPPRQASSVSRTTSRMSGSLRISSMS